MITSKKLSRKEYREGIPLTWLNPFHIYSSTLMLLLIIIRTIVPVKTILSRREIFEQHINRPESITVTMPLYRLGRPNLFVGGRKAIKFPTTSKKLLNKTTSDGNVEPCKDVFCKANQVGINNTAVMPTASRE